MMNRPDSRMEPEGIPKGVDETHLGDDNFWPVQCLNLADCQSCSHCENLIKCKASQPDSVLLRPSIHNGFNSPCAVSLPVNGNNILKVNAVLESLSLH